MSCGTSAEGLGITGSLERISSSRSKECHFCVLYCSENTIQSFHCSWSQGIPAEKGWFEALQIVTVYNSEGTFLVVHCFLQRTKMRVSVQDLREAENEDGEEEEEVFLKPVIEDRNMELARKCSEIISDIPYKEEFKKSKGKCISVPDTPQLKHVKSLGAFLSEVKYKGAAKKDLSNSLYQQMPATIDSVFAKGLTQLQSKVLYTQKHAAEKGTSDYAHMKEPPDIKHAMEVTKHQSDK
ncbi:nebulette-like [Melanerpes formicivorus]|uniref:nebulette-like n=1 Tax=Melanerpes formicivorus TaxID=211600 RepID=UPI00358FBCD0